MEITDHNQCYFCQTKTVGFKKRKLDKIVYPDVASVKRPRPWKDGEEKPIPFANFQSSGGSSPKEEAMDSSANSFDAPQGVKLFDQASLNDLVRNCNLPKETSEILAQTLSDRGMLAPDCKITFYRTRHESYAEFFKEEDNITFCADVE